MNPQPSAAPAGTMSNEATTTSNAPRTSPSAHFHLNPNIVVCGDPVKQDKNSKDVKFRAQHHHHQKRSDRPSHEFHDDAVHTHYSGATWGEEATAGGVDREWKVEETVSNDASGQLDIEEKGELDEYKDRQSKLSLAQRTLRITWAWFPINMSTGAIASLLPQQPYTFNGLITIGKAVYILNLVLFCLFFILIVARFVRKPRALSTSLHHPSESFYFGGFWVAVGIIILGIQAYGVPECGPWLVTAMRVIFWTYYAMSGIIAVFQYHIIFQVEKLGQSDAMPAWILPAYPLLVIGVLASNVAETQPPQSSLEIIIGGLAAQGLGWVLAIFIYTVYFTRLIHSDLPSPAVRPGMYMSVGPAAYTCAGLLALGRAAMSNLPSGFLGIEAFSVGELWYAMSVPAALFLWLVAAWFSALSTVACVREMRAMTFSLQWWSFIFPNAGLALATIQIGNALDSKGIKITGVVITVILIPLWIFNAIMHVRAMWRRELLAPGCDMGVEDVNEKHDIKVERRKKRKMRLRHRGTKSQ
jgi:C4-dicarboxylate transporter/malic acid transport protein